MSLEAQLVFPLFAGFVKGIFGTLDRIRQHILFFVTGSLRRSQQISTRKICLYNTENNTLSLHLLHFLLAYAQEGINLGSHISFTFVLHRNVPPFHRNCCKHGGTWRTECRELGPSASLGLQSFDPVAHLIDASLSNKHQQEASHYKCNIL